MGFPTIRPLLNSSSSHGHCFPTLWFLRPWKPYGSSALALVVRRNVHKAAALLSAPLGSLGQPDPRKVCPRLQLPVECAGRKSPGFVSPYDFPSSIPFPRHPKLCPNGDAEGAVVHRPGDSRGRQRQVGPVPEALGSRGLFQALSATVSGVSSSCVRCRRARLDRTLRAQERLIDWYRVPSSLSYTHSSPWGPRATWAPGM